MTEHFSFISFIFFLFVGLIVFALIIVKSVKNYKSATHSKGKVIAKAVAAFLIWIISSLYVFLSNAVYTIGIAHRITPPPTEKIDGEIIELAVLQVIWSALGIGLVYWVSRKTKEKL